MIVIQELLYNKVLSERDSDRLRGALHEIDQLLLLPQTAKSYNEMKENGLKAVDPRGAEVASKKNMN